MIDLFYVEVQQLDYDDFPMSTPIKIGPFESEDAAEFFLEVSPDFSQRNGAWKRLNMLWTNHTVKIKNLLDQTFAKPEWFM